MILLPFHTDTPCEPHYSGRMGSYDQGHEADFSQWSLPEQFIEVLRALDVGTRVDYWHLDRCQATQL